MSNQIADHLDSSGNAHGLDLPHTLAELRAIEQRLVARFTAKRAAREADREQDEAPTFGQRIADIVAATIGSWRFIIIQSAILMTWIALNVSAFVTQWDPYPFILLNLMLSFQAAYAAPIIMMSQNRQEARDRIRAELDLETDLKAETLIEDVHLHVLDLRLKRWEELLSIQQRQIDMLTDLVARAGSQHLPIPAMPSPVRLPPDPEPPAPTAPATSNSPTPATQ